MMTNLYFQVASLFYMLIVIFLFFSKRRVENVETKMFAVMSLVNVVGIVLDIVIVYLSYVIPFHTSLYVLNKFYLIYILLWTSYFFMYIVYISVKEKLQLYRTIKKLNITLIIISGIIIFVLPINLFNENNVMYTYGGSVTFLYLIEVLYMLVIGVLTFFNIRNLISRKYLPIFVLLFMCLVALVVRAIEPSLLLTTSIITFINVLMYHTIENPDMKVITELNVARESAEKANNAKTEFLSNMSHEIRTPLNAIVGFSEVIKTTKTVEDAHENADYILKASNTLLEIVNGVLDISRIESGKLEITNVDYETNQLFENVVRLITPRAKEKNLEFKVDIPGDLPKYLNGDYVNIRTVLVNLLSNSVKYTKQGYIELKVNSVIKNNVCRLIFSVEDTGRGIKKEDLERIFERFQRLDDDRNTTTEGTGLGLAITKRIIELMNGNIVVQSEYGKGSKFTVTIDQHVAEVKAEYQPEEIDIDSEKIDFSGKRILIVDDNKINIKVASRLLKDYNFEIDESLSGIECFQKIINGEKYDLILLDDMMPEQSGTETMKKLRELSDFSIPVIVFTANALSGMREKYIKEGFDEYLSKPIHKEELIKMITKFIKI